MISSADKPQIARLFEFIARGEEIASFCATQQSKLATQTGMQRFFTKQAKQEHQHAFLFHSGATWLAPKKSYRSQAVKNFDVFEKKLNTALAKNRLLESLIAQQIILEGLGEITLEKISSGMEIRGLRLRRLREIILKQEHAHHHFGTKQVRCFLQSPDLDLNALRKDCEDYLNIILELLTKTQTLFEYFHQDTSMYYQYILNELPPPLRINP